MEKLTKFAVYFGIAVTASIFIMFLMSFLPHMIDSYERDWKPNAPQSEEELRARFIAHPAYIAMHERYPDAKEQVNYEQRDKQGNMQVGITNFERGNTLMLTMNYNSNQDKVSAFPMCQGDDEEFLLLRGELFTVEYIENTTCVDSATESTVSNERIVTPTPWSSEPNPGNEN